MLFASAVLKINLLSILPVNFNPFHGFFASASIASEVLIFIILSLKSFGNSWLISIK